jgi:hypothetical protein
MTHINSDSYDDKNPITIVFEYFKEKENINFRVSSENFTKSAEWDSLNDFNIYIDGQEKKYMENTIDFQIFLTKFLLRNNINHLNKDLTVTTIPLDIPENYRPTKGFSLEMQIFENVIPAVISLTYISLLFKFVLNMVVEKEKKLKDLITRQGISTFQYFLSWLFTFIILATIPIILNSVLLTIYFFERTNFFFILVNIFLFSLNIIGMSVLFHQFVDNVRSGQALLKLLYISVSILSIAINSESTPAVLRYLFYIFPQTILKSSFELFMQAKV